jgi:hypothetical protein
MSEEPIFPPVAQPPQRAQYLGPGSQPVSAIIDNRTDLSDSEVRQVIEDKWVEYAGLQLARPNTFQMYSNVQTSMLARQPFKTPGNVIQEIELARALADTDDDVAGTLGLCNAVAFGEGLQNQHRDEKTLEFFNQMTAPTAMDLVSVMEEMYREFLIAGSVTTITLFTRQRMQYFPLKSKEPVQAQLQVPHVGVLPAENIRVITNDILNEGELAFHSDDINIKRWLDAFLSPKTPGRTRAIMAMEEPVMAALFVGRKEIPYTDSDPNTRGKTVYLLNKRMVHRSSMPKGAQPYARPPLTRNFALLEAKRLLNLLDYAFLQGGASYIVVAKKGTDNLPAQQPEIDNLVGQVTHASRSGVMVGDHRLTIEIISPDLTNMLDPAKRRMVGRKISMGLLRQNEQVTSDAGNQGALNEMELLARVVGGDRAKMIRHAQATFYDETANRNRSTFTEGAPSIWGAKIVLAGAKDFWSNLLNARDRGDVPRRWLVEALGYDYDAALAERERELARGDDDILMPASVPFSNDGEPQDNNEGRPKGTSSNNGRGKDSPGQGRDNFRPRRVIQRNSGETVKAIVEGDDVSYFGETTYAILAEIEGEAALGYVTEIEREAIEGGAPLRNGRSIIVPVNVGVNVSALHMVKLDDGLRMVVGTRLGDEAIVAKALRFSEPQYDLNRANDMVLRWGFVSEPLIEDPAPDNAT